jgi:hypothetical protein
MDGDGAGRGPGMLSRLLVAGCEEGGTGRVGATGGGDGGGGGGGGAAPGLGGRVRFRSTTGTGLKRPLEGAAAPDPVPVAVVEAAPADPSGAPERPRPLTGSSDKRRRSGRQERTRREGAIPSLGSSPAFKTSDTERLWLDIVTPSGCTGNQSEEVSAGRRASLQLFPRSFETMCGRTTWYRRAICVFGQPNGSMPWGSWPEGEKGPERLHKRLGP